MKPNDVYLPTEAEVRSTYREGENAVVSLFEQIAVTVKQLAERLLALEDQLAKNSNNSSKPPSSDGYQKPSPKSLRKRHQKKSGGQPGHSGYTLKAVEHPDHIEVHPVTQCLYCHAGLEEVEANSHEKRQVFDVPRVRIEVTEHQAEIKCCPQCGEVNKAVFPEWITQPVQYGAEIKAQAVYFNQYQMLPLERSGEVFEALYGQALSEGTILDACQEVAERVKPVNVAIKSHLTEKEETVHFDETGARVEGKLNWLHSASTARLTYYKIHTRRGEVAMEIGRACVGKECRSRWSPYH